MTDRKRDGDIGDISQQVFRLTLIVLAFLVGGIYGAQDRFPFNVLRKVYTDTALFVKEQVNPLPDLLAERAFPGDDVTVLDEEKAYAGLTIMQGWFSDGAQVRLVDMRGNVLHQWMIDFHRIWPDAKHIFPEKNVPKTSFNYHTQGMEVFQDGSIVANIGNAGTFKMDRCGEILWTVDRMTHHSVTRFSDGTFWIPANKDYRTIPDRLLFGEANKETLAELQGRYENVLLHVDKNGRIIGQFSVLESVVQAGMEHQLVDALKIRIGDPTHTNDIEEVNQALADKIEGVNRGDLLISIRQFDMLAILDVDTGKIKWHQSGPWVRQHDPDITEDGDITVFNNRRIGFFVRGRPGSNIIHYNPETGETRILYAPLEKPRSKDQRNTFYTDIMGSHQVLPNGNILIAESRRGRVFEVDRGGDIVWEYIKAYDEDHAALIEVAERLDENYFDVDHWGCAERP